MLLEIFTDPKYKQQAAQISEALKISPNNATLLQFFKDLIASLTDILAKVTDSKSETHKVLAAHLTDVKAAYDVMRGVGANGQSTGQSAPQVAKPSGMSLVLNGDNSCILNADGKVVDVGTEQAMKDMMAAIEAGQLAPLKVANDAVNEALEKFPKLAGKMRADLENAVGNIETAIADIAPAERMAAAQAAVADLVNSLADREAQRTGKDRMEIIEGFRAVAGKRQAAAVASVEVAIVGTYAPIIPAGTVEQRDTPNSEMTIEVT